jgi:hypothetical protein
MANPFIEDESEVLLKNFKTAGSKQQYKLLNYLKTKKKRPDPSGYKSPEEVVPKINPLAPFEKALESDKDNKELEMKKQKYRAIANKYRTA